ncbi:MAG: CRISPR-associated protein Cas4 [Candidatus Kerfeldbacteria bacterium]|nr:CRISPR-associated protein Cas4 [Candidatus Kerfeldbacteria bacterium]
MSYSSFVDHEFLSVHIVAEYAFCPRSAFNLLTGAEVASTGSFREGRVMHNRVDQPTECTHRGAYVERSLRVQSLVLGLVGVIDQVRSYTDGRVEVWEYKRGTQRDAHTHELQIALLSLCYRDETGVTPNIGVVWTTGDRRSRRFNIASTLLAEAEQLVQNVSLKRQQGTPWPRRPQSACHGCIFRYDCWSENELSHL